MVIQIQALLRGTMAERALYQSIADGCPRELSFDEHPMSPVTTFRASFCSAPLIQTAALWLVPEGCLLDSPVTVFTDTPKPQEHKSSATEHQACGCTMPPSAQDPWLQCELPASPSHGHPHPWLPIAGL
ncbi:hypothetical protein P7K49_005490 [Saguinus oedipus]|uniref:Uncharacterized protein n=1 Tax=Saguinus oedipus TaxID=9490 RepID=A0ABQ9WAE5_SAGOE|nr:hypothetical protein P7K49_005490 [Saguinus oedipus]